MRKRYIHTTDVQGSPDDSTKKWVIREGCTEEVPIRQSWKNRCVAGRQMKWDQCCWIEGLLMSHKAGAQVGESQERSLAPAEKEKSGMSHGPRKLLIKNF